jgi:predicted nucleic acid-binding protein
MKAAFADTVYWVAMARPNDPWQQAARTARARLGSAQLTTTEEVLTEFLAAMSAGGPKIRRQAVKMVRAILAAPDVEVIPQSHESFLKGLDMYEQRPDKAYSLTDCISMNAMRAAELPDALTNDRHFQEEGFNALMMTG